MDYFDVEQELCIAVEHAVPDVKDEILRRCTEEHSEQDRMVPMNFEPQKRRRKSYLQTYIAAAAIMLLMVNVGVSMLKVREANRTETIIGLDVNPSIELAVNGQNRVISATAINEDADKVLEGMDLSGATTEVAVNAVLGSMLKLGYLDESSNSILVSVDNKNEESSKEIETRLVENINETLQSYSVDAAILSQTVTTVDDTISQTATDYEISQGRTVLIQKIIENNPDYTFEELSQLTINELNLLLSSQRVEVQNITTTGVASETSYIGQDAATEAVFSAIAVTKDQVTDLYADIDVLNARMVYGISFLYGGLIYSYEVDALTGEIVANCIDYPVTEVPETADITEVLNTSPETVSGESENTENQGAVTSSDHTSAGGEAGSDNAEGSENDVISGNEVVSENEADENSSIAQEDTVSDNQTETAEGSVSGNMVEDEITEENPDSDSLYETLFKKRKGMLSAAELVWQETGEDVGEYAQEWMKESQLRSQALSQAEVNKSDVINASASIYQMDEKYYYLIEFETRTHVYQYILDAVEGTVVEYEMRRR
ncbi:MAG: hypothetical protein ACI4DW_00185 [Lachnospiraceae bacterium]